MGIPQARWMVYFMENPIIKNNTFTAWHELVELVTNCWSCAHRELYYISNYMHMDVQAYTNATIS